MAENKIEIRVTAKDDASRVFQQFANSVERYFNDIQDASQRAVQNIQNAWKNIQIDNIFIDLSTDADTAADQIANVFRTLAANIDASFTDIKSEGDTAFDKMEEEVKDFGHAAKREFEKVEQWSDSSAKNVLRDWKRAGSAADDTLGTFSTKARDDFEAIESGAKESAHGIDAAMTKAFNDATQVIEKFKQEGIQDINKLEREAKTSAKVMKGVFDRLKLGVGRIGAISGVGAGAAGAAAAGAAGAGGLAAGGVAGLAATSRAIKGQIKDWGGMKKAMEKVQVSWKDMRGIMKKHGLEPVKGVSKEIRKANQVLKEHQGAVVGGIPGWAKLTAGIYAGITAIRLFVRAGTAAITAANEQAQSVIQMETVMRSMGNFSVEYSRKLQNIASSLQLITTYGDEAILSGTKFLLTYKDIGEVNEDVVMTMLDLAALMDGDVERAANMLGKAAMGLTGELRRVGITVDQETFKLEGFAGVLKQIQEQVGGQAKAVRKAVGPWKSMRNAAGDVLETIGDVLKLNLEPTVEGWTKSLGKLAANWRENVEAAKQMREEGFVEMDFSAEDPFGEIWHGPSKEFIEFQNQMESGFGMSAEKMKAALDNAAAEMSQRMWGQFSATFKEIEALHADTWKKLVDKSKSSIQDYRSGVKELYEQFKVGGQEAALVDVAQLRERLMRFQQLGLDQQNLQKAAYDGMSQIMKDYATKGETSVLNMLNSIKQSTHEWFNETKEQGGGLAAQWEEFMKPVTEQRELQISAEAAGKEVAEVVRQVLELKKQLEDANYMNVQTGEAIAALKRLKTEYMNVKAAIEGNPPKITAQVEASGSPTMSFSNYMRYMMDKLDEVNGAVGVGVSMEGMQSYIEALRGVRSDMRYFENWAQLIATSPGANLSLAGFHNQVASMGEQLEQVVILAGQAGVSGIDSAVGGMRMIFGDMRRALELYGLGNKEALIDFQRLQDMFNTGLMNMLAQIDAATTGGGGDIGDIGGGNGTTTTTGDVMEVNIHFGGITINAEILGRNVEYDSEELAAMIDQKIGEEIIYDRSRVRDAMEEVFLNQ